MADKQGSLELLLSCQVCLEEYVEDGDHVPRLLPCTHTVCEFCIKKLISDKKLNCPECRTKHEAESDTKTFPQNKYLIAQIRRLAKEEKENEDSERCEEHGKELNMFCREPLCQKTICISCMKDHRKHDVLNIEEKLKDDLLQNVDNLRKKLEIRKQIGIEIKKDLAMKTEECIEVLEKRKDELVDHINAMITEAKEIKKETEHHVEAEISVVEVNLSRADKIKQDLESKKDPENRRDLKTLVGTVMQISEISDQALITAEFLQYPVFQASESSAETALGSITRDQLAVTTADEIPESLRVGLGPRSIADASEIKCTGKFPKF